jgi:hypothetical protein
VPQVRPEQRPIRSFRLAIAAVLLVAIALTAIALAAGFKDDEQPTAKKAEATQHPTWIVSGWGLAALRRSNAGLARRFFDNQRTLVLGEANGMQNLVPAGYRSIPALSYTSLAEFTADAGAGLIAPEIGAVLYDPESWDKTPAVERGEPLAAMHRFSRLARRRGYSPIVSPGRDLALSGEAGCGKRQGELLDQAYLRCDLTAGASGAETFVIQAAPDELEPTKLSRLLASTRAQARSRAPEALTVATLSTDPPGASEPVWPIDLLRAARIEFRQVDGVLFNFNQATMPLAASFLRDLEREDGHPQ